MPRHILLPVIPDQVGHDGGKVIKREFQLQAAGTRFSLIYSAAGRYGASQIHSYFKTKPDSLTNQGLPGLNTANLCCFFITNKFLLVFFISVTHLFDYMHYQCDLIRTKVMPRRYPST